MLYQERQREKAARTAGCLGQRWDWVGSRCRRDNFCAKKATRIISHIIPSRAAAFESTDSSVETSLLENNKFC